MQKRNRRILIIVAVSMSLVVAGFYFSRPSFKDDILVVHGVSFTTILENKSSSFFIPKSMELKSGDIPCGFTCHEIQLDFPPIPQGAISFEDRWQNCDDNGDCPEQFMCLLGENGEVIQTMCPEYRSSDGGICTIVICDVIIDDLIIYFPKDLKVIKPEYFEDLKKELEIHLPEGIEVLAPNQEMDEELYQNRPN